MAKYLFFDLDGTLCESKKDVKDDMLQELGRLSKKYGIILVSGAELSRMLIQAPLKYAIFMAQNGNEAYDHENMLWQNEFENKKFVIDHIETVAKELDIKIVDDMIDDRGSQVSFSFIGHHAPLEVKKLFDPTRKKRADLLDKYKFTGAVIGGTTCIDYAPYTKGENIQRYLKLKNIRPQDCLYMGDAFMNFGNDATVLGVIPVHKINTHEDTLEFIKQL
jgi:phosphomannomutase